MNQSSFARYLAEKGEAFPRNRTGVMKNLFEAAEVPMKRLLAQGYRILTTSKDGLLSGAPP